MATAEHDFDGVSDYILSKINIHVSGACGPNRAQPLQCFSPVHQAYRSDLSKKQAPIDKAMESVVPGGVPRPIRSDSNEGHGLVYDRDISTIWRLPSTMAAYEIFFWEKEFERALGRNTMFVVLESFYDVHPEILADDCDGFTLMQTFRTFVEELGTQIVSITASSIVYDMVAGFQRMKKELNTERFLWERCDLVDTLHEFVLTRECWQYAEDQEPALEIAFGVTGGRRGRNRSQVSDQIVLHFHYSWYPPTVGFQSLQNVVLESTDFVLKPSVTSARPFSQFRQLLIEYYIGPTHRGLEKKWLQ